MRATWQEYKVDVTVELLDDGLRTIDAATTTVLLRTEGAPRVTTVPVRFPEATDTDDIANLSVEADVIRLAGSYHGHGMWFSFAEE